MNAADRRDGESKIEADSTNRDLGNATKKGSTLRRRFLRRGPSPGEEGKHGDAYSPRDKVEAQESKEHDTPTKPPRYSAPSTSAQPMIDDATSKAIDEGGKHHRHSSLPIMHQSNYIRKPDEKLREKFKNRLRSVADIPEVHFIGEVTEGIGFKDTYVSCKW